MRKELKTQLIQQCKDAVGNDVDGRRPLNIAVIGPPGCGKSSFLNTIFASFKNNDGACWREIAKMGDYGEHDIRETTRLRISENTKVDRIIVVCTANRVTLLPESLLRAIRDTAKRGIRRTPPLLERLLRASKKGSRAIPVYGVLTHADKRSLNYREYRDRQERFKNHLGLIPTRFKCIENYCTDVDPTISYISTTLPRLDNPVLELMTQVLFPHPDDTPTPDKTNSMSKIAFAAAIFIILLAIVLKIVL